MLVTRQQLRAHVMASDDPTRFALTHLKVEPSGRVSATNGHVAVRVTPTFKLDEGEFPSVPGLNGAEPEADLMIPADMARAAEKIIPKGEILPILAVARLLVSDRAVIGATDLQTPQIVTEQREIQSSFDFQFPDVGAVIPDGPGVMTITLSADYLERVAKYAKAFSAPGHAVTLTVYAPDQGVRFAWSDPMHDVVGCIMPMRA